MKPGLKVSGLIAAGRIAPAPNVAPSTAFDRVPPQNAEEPLRPEFPKASPQLASTFGAAGLPIYDGIGIPESGKEIMMRIDWLDDSPFQTRLKIRKTREDEIGESLRDTGQADAIEVRFLRPGRAEIIKGHTRKNSAKSIGWELVRVLPRTLNDQEAAQAVLIDNTSEPPTDYEYGHSFKLRLDRKLASTQAELGLQVGMTQSEVSKRLAMLELPPPVLKMLDEDPALFGVTTAGVVKSLWLTYPDHSATILRGLQRIKEGADQGGLKAWVVQQLGSKGGTDDGAKRTILSPSGHSKYVRIIKGRDLIIRLSDKNLDLLEQAALLDKFLDSLGKEG